MWIVSGIDGDLSQLTWKRIASGLFQPLGVKIVDETIYVTCRDQIARLRDLNGDGEIDFIENFNNDHQVTEHFHEFAMGLQTDAGGKFLLRQIRPPRVACARAASRHVAQGQQGRLQHRNCRERFPRRQRRLRE